MATEIWVLGLEFWLYGLDLAREAGIWSWGLEFGSQGWDLGLEAWIWTLSLDYGPRLGIGLQGRKAGPKEKKFLHKSESKGHRFL